MNLRLKIIYGVLIAVMAIFIARLFYLQIIKHDYYRKSALQSQLKEYDIPAERGLIKAYDGGQPVTLVLNQKLYTLFADPGIVKNPSSSAEKLAAITKGDVNKYQKAMTTKNTRYAVLSRKLSQAQNDKILSLKLPGIGTQPQDYRVYPQGSLAAQILGFVDTEGKGKYGVEQALNPELAGSPGKLKAITDAAGVPLAASKENVEISPKNGSEVTLTIDLSMQKQLEDILSQGISRARSSSASVLVIEANSGAIKAMANLPTYNPAEYFKQSDPKVFNNAAVSEPLEVGSTMKTLTAAAGLDLGVISKNTSYEDPNRWRLDDHDVTNVENIGAGRHSIADVLNLSINTGATWILMQMGGQTGRVNQQARSRWYDYMTDHYRLGQSTGVEQGYEATGRIPKPNEGFAHELTYANTSFGQAMTATPLQMAAAFAAVVNGGSYYQPHLVDKVVSPSGKVDVTKSKVVRNRVVSSKVSRDMRSLLAYAVKQHALIGFSYMNFPKNYQVGGKTGTAQIANPAGGYYSDRFNGTYLGFVGGDQPQYVIMVRVSEPHIGGYAGSVAAQPIFADVVKMLINNFNVSPSS